jgi:hypothetical protein
MWTSDFVTLHGFPHHRYLLTLKHEPTAESDFQCTKRGYSADNLSRWDASTKRQIDCVLYTTGEPRPDGGFNIFLGTTWIGRYLWKDRPIEIPASDIIEARLSE